MAPSIRLDKLLVGLGYASRREAQAMIRSRRVALAGMSLGAPDQKIGLDQAHQVTVDNVTIDPLPGMVLILNKPVGVVCSHKEAGRRVYDLLPDRWARRDPPLSTVGRLDKDTSGLLLLTDDGQLLHKIISPRSDIRKRYAATLARSLRGDEPSIFASGRLILDGEHRPLLPASLEILGPTTAVVTIVEGRYHQVRRMFAAVGNHVLGLHRERIGDLALPPDLESGAYVLLGAKDIERIFAVPS